MTKRWELDPAHTTVEFSVKHMMMTTVRGRFSGVAGFIEVDEQHPERSRVEVTIDASTIDTGVADRDAHLRSADFLDVEKHPAITFRSTRVDGVAFEEGARFTVVGELTIRGETNEVDLETTFQGRGRDPWGGERAGFGASTRIDRRDWGLRWNQALEAGGILVGNEVRIEIDAQAVLKEQEEQAVA